VREDPNMNDTTSPAQVPGLTRETADAITAAVADGAQAVRTDLADLVRIPSVSRDGADSRDVVRSAEAVAALLADAGADDVRVLDAADGAPAVVARFLPPDGAPTVLLYAHHDVQPAGDLDAWDSDPFMPEVRDGRMYGRGAADDKAGVMAHVGALRALRAVYPDGLPVGVTVFAEGEEEVGSPSLPAFLEEYHDLLAADVVVIADSGNWAIDIPGFTTSLRGLVEMFIEVRTSNSEQHSGVYGGLFPDALTALCRILAQLHDADGTVAVPGLVSGAVPTVDLDESALRAEAGMREGVAAIGRGTVAQRLWSEPAISVLGIDAPSTTAAANVLLPVARAKVSMRIAAGQDPQAALEALAAHLVASAPWGVSVTAIPGTAGQAIALLPSGPAAEVATAAFTAAWDGVAPVHMGIGGSIPFIADMAESFPAATIIVVGPGDPAACWHGPNESVDLGVLHRLTLAQALMLAGLGAR
jgi:acetylornithine deacetylase/succinyl-diaminopimelate desuccinylase-like protein